MNINIQKPTANYTVAGLQRLCSSIIKADANFLSGAKTCEIIIGAWLDSIAPLYKAKWEVYFDQNSQWHIHRKLSSGALRDGVRISPNDHPKSLERWKEYFVYLANTHNDKVFNVTKKRDVLELRIVRPLEIRGDEVQEVRVLEGDEFVSDLDRYEVSIKSASTELLQEAVSAVVLSNAEVIDALSGGNFKIRS